MTAGIDDVGEVCCVCSLRMFVGVWCQLALMMLVRCLVSAGIDDVAILLPW